MTVSELRQRLQELERVHGDCDVLATATDGGEFLAHVRSVTPDVSPDYGAGFPVVVLGLETDAAE